MRVDIPGHTSLTLPDALLGNLRVVHGDRADPWLASLGPLLRDVLTELDAHIVPGDPPLSYHLVFFAERATGEAIAIKATVPNDEQPPEIAAVHALSDAGIGPQLVWSDLDRGMLAMARVQPGDIMPTGMLTLEEDAYITQQIATLAKRMGRTIDIERWEDDLVPVRDYSEALDGVDRGSSLWAHHQQDIEHALDLREALLNAPDRRDSFLHGDLHHYNVLQDASDGSRVIDPKGLVGPAGYDFGAFTYNPVGIQHHPHYATIARQRIDIWAETTGLEWETLRSWGYIAAVLSACWSGQGGAMEWNDAMRVATTLRDLTRVS